MIFRDKNKGKSAWKAGAVITTLTVSVVGLIVLADRYLLPCDAGTVCDRMPIKIAITVVGFTMLAIGTWAIRQNYMRDDD